MHVVGKHSEQAAQVAATDGGVGLPEKFFNIVRHLAIQF
jgi:hypothetical protein